MFVDTDKGAIALSRIISWRYTPGMKDISITYDGRDRVSETAKVMPYDWDSLTAAAPARIPSHPGTYVLWSGLDGDEFYTNRTYVIAWSITADGCPTPITTDGLNDGSASDPLPILHPDGSVEVVADRYFASVDEWKTWAEKEARNKKAKEAA